MRRRFLLTLALALAFPLVLAGAAGAQEQGGLVVTHDDDDQSAVAFQIVYEGETEEQPLGAVDPGETSEEFALPAGTHTLVFYVGTSTRVADEQVTITAGQTLELYISDILGEAAGDAANGGLALTHDLDAPATVGIGVIPEGETDELTLGSVAAGVTSEEFALPEGTHRMALYDGDGTQLLRDYEVTINAGETLELYASALLDDDAGEPSKGILIFYNDTDTDLYLYAVDVESGDRIDPPGQVDVDANNSTQIGLPTGDVRIDAYRAGAEDDLVGVGYVTITAGGRVGLDASDLVAPDDDSDDDEIRTPTRVDTGAGGTAGTGVAAVAVLAAAGLGLAAAVGAARRAA